MKNHNVYSISKQEIFDDPLTEMLHEWAKNLTAAAVELELSEVMTSYHFTSPIWQ